MGRSRKTLNSSDSDSGNDVNKGNDTGKVPVIDMKGYGKNRDCDDRMSGVFTFLSEKFSHVMVVLGDMKDKLVALKQEMKDSKEKFNEDVKRIDGGIKDINKDISDMKGDIKLTGRDIQKKCEELTQNLMEKKIEIRGETHLVSDLMRTLYEESKSPKNSNGNAWKKRFVLGENEFQADDMITTMYRWWRARQEDEDDARLDVLWMEHEGRDITKERMWQIIMLVLAGAIGSILTAIFKLATG